MKESLPEQPNIQETPHPNELQEKLEEDFTQVLEACEENNKELYALEEIITAPPEKLFGLYEKVSNKYRAILGVLIFVASHQITTGVSEIHERSLLSNNNEFTHTAEKRDKVLKLTGIDLASAAEKVNRGIKIYTPETPTNLTIVHVGQHHAVASSPEETWQCREIITKSQSEISAFIIATTTANSSVFVEGYTERVTKELMKKFVHVHLKEIILKIDNAESFMAIKKEYDEVFLNHPVSFLDGSVINKSVGEKLTSFGFTEISPLVYSRGDEQIKLFEIGFFPKNKAYSVPNHIDSGVVGAAPELEARGKIKIESAETDETIDKANGGSFHELNKIGALNELFTKYNQGSIYYQQTKSKTLSANTLISADFLEDIKSLSQNKDCIESAECKQLIEEVTEVAIPKATKLIFDDREDTAVELIAKKATTTRQLVFPVVYGASHDFTRAVSKWNAGHPNMKFNLVTVKSVK